jgi:hypothetical protein
VLSRAFSPHAPSFPSQPATPAANHSLYFVQGLQGSFRKNVSTSNPPRPFSRTRHLPNWAITPFVQPGNPMLGRSNSRLNSPGRPIIPSIQTSVPPQEVNQAFSRALAKACLGQGIRLLGNLHTYSIVGLHFLDSRGERRNDAYETALKAAIFFMS